MNAQASLSEQTVRDSYWHRNQTKIAPLLFLAPAFIMFIVFVVNPVIQSIWISFHEWDGLGDKVWIGFANYVELFDDELFYVSLWNNVIWLVLFMLSPVIGLAIALYLNQKVWGIRLVKVALLLPLRHQPGGGRPGLRLVL